jgi:hypothetical protein
MYEGHAQLMRCSRAAQIHNTRVKTAYMFSNHTAEICFNVREIIQIKVVLV